jgi:calcium-dependent protein kinase
VKLSNLRILPERKAARMFCQILSAMDICHKKNIIHRDLKPGNILFESLSAEGTIKVIDFGRSKFLKPKQQVNECVGSVI